MTNITPVEQPPVQSPTSISISSALTITRTGSHRTQLKTEHSWEEDSALSQTSSTSGYRESCSLLMMTMESPPEQHLPSTSSSTIVPQSPDSSSGDHDITHSQHSLLMVYEVQDEDTLI